MLCGHLSNKESSRAILPFIESQVVDMFAIAQMTFIAHPGCSDAIPVRHNI
jgi:hypothetical protein